VQFEKLPIITEAFQTAMALKGKALEPELHARSKPESSINPKLFFQVWIKQNWYIQ